MTATNGDGSAQATSPASAVILANPPVNTVAPSLSGTAQDGVTLTAAKGTWTGMATITYTYQWQQSSDGGATWSNIAGATATTYTPPAGSAGKQLRAQVTAANSDGTAQATSPASAVILANPPVNTVAPSLSGTAQDGVTVTAASGTWTGMAAITYTYQWQQSSDGGATWNDIAGATATTYTPPAGSAGKQLRAQVTATNSDGTTQSSSPTSAHPRQPARQHRRTQPERNRPGRRHADSRKRHVDRNGHHHLHLPVAAIIGRRRHLERHRRRNRNDLHTAGRIRRQAGARAS